MNASIILAAMIARKDMIVTAIAIQAIVTVTPTVHAMIVASISILNFHSNVSVVGIYTTERWCQQLSETMYMVHTHTPRCGVHALWFWLLSSSKPTGSEPICTNCGDMRRYKES